MLKSAKVIVAAIVTLSALVTMCFGVERYFAKESDFQILAESFRTKVKMDRIKDLQVLVYQKQDRLEAKRDTMTPEEIVQLKADIRELQLLIEEIKAELKKKGS